MKKNRTALLILTTLISMMVVFSFGMNILLANEVQDLKNEIKRLNADKASTSSPVLQEFLTSRDIFNDRTDSLIREPDSMLAELWVVIALEQLHLMKEVLEGRISLDNPKFIDEVSKSETF